jgi:type II secretory pathway predicted ATPase ExeA
MYEAYWKLSGKPFPQRSETSRFLPTQTHQAALLRLKYGLDTLQGPALVLGPSGTGKSTLVRYFAEKNASYRPFVHMVFPSLSADEMLRSIAADLSENTSAEAAGTDLVLRTIQAALRHHHAEGRQPLLCIDDAHFLSDEILQRVILPLTGLSESEQDCSLAIVLAGQPILSSQIRRIGSLSERISVATVLQGFSSLETADYVQSCLQAVRAPGEIFTSSALQRLFEVTGGNPRRINRLSDMALLVGYAEHLREITSSQIDAVSAELMPAAA